MTQRGIEVFFRGRYAEALAFIDEALVVHPAFARAHAAKALCLTQLGNASGGLNHAEKAVALSPAEGIYYTTRAMCKARLGDRDGAETDYNHALTLAPDDYRVYYNVACYWAERSDEEKCRRFLADAFSLADASFADVAADDPDLGRYSDRPWFRELIADVKRRLATR